MAGGRTASLMEGENQKALRLELSAHCGFFDPFDLPVND